MEKGEIPPQARVPKTKISSLAELAERNVKLKRRSTELEEQFAVLKRKIDPETKPK